MLGNCDREGSRHRACDELRKFGVGDERTRLVEDHDRAMWSRPLGLDEIAEGVELEIGGEARRAPCPASGALTVITGAPMLNER